MTPTTVVRTPHLVLEWREGRLVATDGATGRRHAVTVEAMRVLDAADEPATPAELAARTGAEPAEVLALLAAGLLVRKERCPERHRWSALELVVQRTARTVRPPQEREADRAAMPPPAKEAPGPPCELPAADPGTAPESGREGGPADGAAADPPFSRVLAGRRSCRRFAPDPVGAATLGRFLDMACAVQHDARDMGSGVSWRPHPSGGGRHPLETYVYPLNVAGLDRAVYHYDPFRRRLDQVAGAEATLFETARTLHRECELMDGEPAVVLVITAVFERTMWKYDNGGLLIIHQDAGALYQTFYLVATALGLGGCALGGGSDAVVTRALGLDPLREGHVGAFLLGVPADDRHLDPRQDLGATLR